MEEVDMSSYYSISRQQDEYFECKIGELISYYFASNYLTLKQCFYKLSMSLLTNIVRPGLCFFIAVSQPLLVILNFLNRI